MAERLLDIENVGRIGLLFLNGDLLEKVVLNPADIDPDNVNYVAEYFNDLKADLMRIERINPDLKLKGVLWTKHPHNRYVAIPAIAGSSLPVQGCWAIRMPEPLLETMLKGTVNSVVLEDGRKTFYFAVRNTSNDIVGVLELTSTEDVDELYEIIDL